MKERGLTRQTSAWAAAAPISVWARLTRWFQDWFEIPYGYEDASGFHYGKEPIPPQFQSPNPETTHVFRDRAGDAMKYPVPVPTTSEPQSVEPEPVSQPVK